MRFIKTRCGMRARPSGERAPALCGYTTSHRCRRTREPRLGDPGTHEQLVAVVVPGGRMETRSAFVDLP